MFPMGLVCGNTYIVKPSEQDPGACMMLVKLAQEAGVPDGVLNVIHGMKECEWVWSNGRGQGHMTLLKVGELDNGIMTSHTHTHAHTHTAVDFICDNPEIKAISFVGSDRVGKYIHERGSANGKRVQSNMVCCPNQCQCTSD